MTRVLLVEDDSQLVRALRINLKTRGYDVDAAPDGRSALDLAARRHPDVVVLDLGLPDMDGTEVICGLRGWLHAPIIVLSARYAFAEKVQALDLGADDYVTKPFGMDELLARLRAAVGREAPQVARDGMETRLTPTEWSVLEHLVRNAGRLVTQRELLREVWGPGYGKETNYLRVYLAQLRRKLEPRPRPPSPPDHRTGHGLTLRTLIIPSADRDSAGSAAPGRQGVAGLAQAPPPALPRQMGLRQRRGVDAPEGAGRSVQDVQDGRAHQCGVGDGGDPGRGVGEPVQPRRRPREEVEDRFPAVRCLAGVGHPGVQIRRTLGFEVGEAAAPPGAGVKVGQERVRRRVQPQCLRSLPAATLGPAAGGPDTAQDPGARGRRLVPAQVESLVAGETRLPRRLGRRMTDQHDTDGHARSTTQREICPIDDSMREAYGHGGRR